MKHSILIIIFALFTFCANAQQAENITIGKIETIHSKILDEDRKLWIYTPDITSKIPNPQKKYPVLFVLDGDAHFYSTVGIVQQLSQANGNGILPEMIVVGVESSNRLKDFTPTLNTTGSIDNANPFVKFFATELMPYVDENFNTAPYKLLVGHSLGGLITMDILSNYPTLFNAYIAIEPSMWYQNEKFLKQNFNALKNQNFDNIILFIGVANTLPKGITLEMLKNDKSIETQHMRSIFKLDDFLKNTKIPGLKYGMKYYKDDDHNSVPLISEYDGLRFIFDFYRLDATKKDFTSASPALAKKLKAHYDTVSKEMGYKISPPEAVINYFGYDALSKKQFEKAEAMFKLNLEYYPKSYKVFDAYADYFVAKKDTANAIKFYKIALSMNNDNAIQNKLNALTNQNTFSLTENELEKYVGIYTIQPYNINVEFYLQDGSLWSKVKGQKDEELVPISPNAFRLRNKQSYTITFKTNDNKIMGFTSVQPNGTFNAVLKN